ncbi:DUF3558 family protein [Nocardia beijingensis]|uniref:DUF3558 family protein n=1 Tax=Nocardia beijingensis TaxID=95162 RepID=UPI0033A1C708
MRRRTTGRGVATVACGAVLLLAGCETSSESTSPTPSRAASVTSSGASSTTARADGGPAAPEPTRPDAGTTAPVITASGSPAATSAGSAAGALWDPCTLPESDLSAAGLDTTTKARISDATFPTWQMCRWQSIDRTFQLVIAASERTIDDLLEPGTYQDLRRTEFYGRQVIQYRSVADVHRLGCDVGTPAAFGSIVFAVRNTRIQTDVGDPCADANRVGAGLFRSLP